MVLAFDVSGLLALPPAVVLVPDAVAPAGLVDVKGSRAELEGSTSVLPTSSRCQVGTSDDSELLLPFDVPSGLPTGR